MNVSEETTPAPLLSKVRVNGTDYSWTPEGGLDPAAVLSLDCWIFKNANRLAHIAEKSGLSVDDLIQEGRLGALEAARRFNPSQAGFMTFATYGIQGRMLDALGVMGVHLTQKERRSLRLSGGLPVVCSLDAPMPSGDATLGDLIAGPPDEDGRSLGEAFVLANDVRRALSAIPPDEAELVRRYFGIQCQAETESAICHRLGYSRPCMRNILKKCIMHLRLELIKSLKC